MSHHRGMRVRVVEDEGMLSVEEARRVVLECCLPLPSIVTPLLSAHGKVLAEDIRSDIDMPPWDRSVMDGYAVQCGDLPNGMATLQVLEEITAGFMPTKALGAGQCSRIMTGAPIPPGADAIIMVERTRAEPPDRVVIEDRPPRPGQHILRRGEEMRRDEVVLQRGATLRPQEIGVLAAVGRTAVATFSDARVAVLATGDELVEPGTIPGAGCIRNSNAYMLLAQVDRVGASGNNLGIASDSMSASEMADLLAGPAAALDVLILSGGVSAGTKDFVPQALSGAGVTTHFHKVHLKPGKPLLFGTLDRPQGRLYVFGLPGNPVSSFVCFELFVRPLLRKLAGFANLDLPWLRAELGEEYHARGDRPTYAPAQLQWPEGKPRVQPVPWSGSADLRSWVRANAFLRIPPGEMRYPVGHVADVLRLDG